MLRMRDLTLGGVYWHSTLCVECVPGFQGRQIQDLQGKRPVWRTPGPSPAHRCHSQGLWELNNVQYCMARVNGSRGARGGTGYRFQDLQVGSPVRATPGATTGRGSVTTPTLKMNPGMVSWPRGGFPVGHVRTFVSLPLAGTECSLRRFHHFLARFGPHLRQGEGPMNPSVPLLKVP